jgi:hypothetical protein
MASHKKSIVTPLVARQAWRPVSAGKVAPLAEPSPYAILDFAALVLGAILIAAMKAERR